MMRLSRLPITLKLVLTFAGLALVVFAGGGYLVGSWAQTLVENERLQAFHERSDHLADKLEDRLRQVELGALALEHTWQKHEDYSSEAPPPTPTPNSLLPLIQTMFPDVAQVVLVKKGQPQPLWSRADQKLPPLLPETWSPGRLASLAQRDQPGLMGIFLSLPKNHPDQQKTGGTLLLCFAAQDLFSDILNPGADHQSDRAELKDSRGNLLAVFKTPAGKALPNKTPGTISADLGLIHYQQKLAQRGWTLVTAQPATELAGPMDTAQSRFLGVALVAALVCLLFLFFPLRFLVRPLQSLTETVRRLEQGDLSARVSIDSDDEVGALASSFNEMASTLQKQTDNLKETARALDQKSRQLKMERDRTATAVKHMPDGLLFLDDRGEIIMTNQKGKVLSDLMAMTNLETRVRNCPTGEAEDCHSCLVGTEKEHSACLMESGGRIYEVLSTLLGTPQFPQGKILLSRDITERLAMNEQQAHQERLSVLGILSAVVAHEINNPLSAISMYAQMLEDELPKTSAFREHTEVIRRNITTCKNTIRSLLDHAQAEGPEPVELDLHDVVEDVVRFIQPLAKRASVHLLLNLEAKQSLIKAEEGGLRQVLINLIMNGLQAMDAKGGLLKIRSSQGTGGFLVLDMEDSGRGIPEDARDKIFEPFFTTKGPGKGTGLGLPTTVRILESMGAHLNLISTSEQGTHFQLRLRPVTLPATAQPATTSARSTP